MLLGIAQRDGLIQPLHHLARDLARSPAALTLSQGVIATMAVQRQPKEQCAKGDAKNARNRAYGFTSRNRINSVFPLLIAQISFCDWFVRHVFPEFAEPTGIEAVYETEPRTDTALMVM